MKVTTHVEAIDGAARSTTIMPPVMAKSRGRKRLAAACTAAVALTLGGHAAQAAAYNWVAPSGTVWDAGWTGGNIPTISDDLTVLGPVNTPGALTIDVTTNVFARTINFTDPFPVTLSNSSGTDNTLSLAAGMTVGTGAVTIGSTTAGTGVGINLTATQTWNVGTGGLTVNNAVSGTGAAGLIKSGAGTLTLRGVNTYTGATNLGGGSFVLDGSTGSMAATAISGNGGTFVYDNTNATGAKVLTLGALTASTGATTISNIQGGATTSQITLASNARSTGASLNYALSGSGASIFTTAANNANRGIFLNGADYVIQAAGAAIRAPVYGAGGDSGYSKASENAGSISGGNNWLADQNSTIASGFNGATIKINGSFTITNNATATITGILLTGGSTSTINNNSLRVNTGGGDIVFRMDTSADSLIVNSNVVVTNNTTTANTAVTKTGAGTLTFSGTTNNNYGGNTSIVEGTLRSTKNSGIGFGATFGNTTLTVGNTSVAAGARLILSGASAALTVNEPITLNGGSLENDSAANAVTIDSGVAGISFTNGGTGYTAGNLTLTGGGGTGTTAAYTVTSGVVSTITTSVAGTGYTSAPTVTGTGGTGLVATAVLSSVTLNGAANTLGGVGNMNINAVVADGASSGGFTKTGTGILTFTGANTYTGATNVTAGRLLVNGSTAGGAVTVTNAGSLLGGTGTIGGSVTVGAGAILQGGVGITTGALTLSNTSPLTLNSGSVIGLTLGAGNAHSTLALTGTSNTYNGFQSNQGFLLDGIQLGTYDDIITGVAANIDTTAWQVLNAGGFTYSFIDDNAGHIDLSVTAVPEPSTWVGGLLMSGWLAWSLRRRWRPAVRPA